MTPLAEIRHSLPKRTRLYIPEQRGDMVWFQTVAAAIDELPEVTAVRANARSASLVVEHAVDCFEAVQAAAQAQSWFQVQSLPLQKAAAIDEAGKGMRELDERLRQLTRGELDTRSVIFLVFLMLAIVQLARGQVLGPAASLLWYALDTLRSAADSGSDHDDPGPSA